MTGKKNFGFDVHGGHQIDLDRADAAFSQEIGGVIPAWNACINCGSCSATCPAGVNFRRVHYQIKISVETDNYQTDNYPSLQSCLLCGKCQLVCPRGIPTRYLAIRISQRTKHYAEGIPSV
jgi:ferredoxin